MKISKQQLIEIMPSCKGFVELYLSHINKYAEQYGVDTPRRWSHVIAQIAVESNSLKSVRENLNYSAEALVKVFPKYFTARLAKDYARNPQKIANRVYAGRMGNGNELSGDGWKYRGRGLIQITGRYMYALCSTGIGVDLVTNPELLEKPINAVASAFWYMFKYAKLMPVIDENDVTQVTKKINGGTHALDKRRAFQNRALIILTR